MGELRRDEALSFKLTPGLLFTRPAKGKLDTLNQMKAVAFTDGTIDCWRRGLRLPSGPKRKRMKTYISGEAVASSHFADENKKPVVTIN